MENQRGYSLVSQQIRNLILNKSIKVPESNLALLESDVKEEKKKKGWFAEDSLEKRIQPGSFEPSLDGEAFMIDTDG
jgi:hypothetical protein